MSSPQQLGDNDLRSFANRYVPRDYGMDIDKTWLQPYTRCFKEFDLDRSAISTHLAVMFWQIARETKSFSDTRRKLGLSRPQVQTHDELVVGHGEVHPQQFSLVVLEDQFSGFPNWIKFEASDFDWYDAYQKWIGNGRRNLEILQKDSRISDEFASLMNRLLDAIDADFATQMVQHLPFYMLAAERPPLVRTGIPMSPWPVSATAGQPLLGSAGAVVRQQQQTNRMGVTIAAHAAPHNSSGFQVDINGQTGTIVSCDVISDSCFVELGHIGPPNHQPTIINGVLHSIPPIGTTGQFEGCKSRPPVPAMIQAVNINVAIQLPLIQQTFNLSRQTQPGDSGCAFLDNRGVLIGFAVASTQGTLPPQYSTWMWVDPVFTYHSLQAF